MSINKFYPINVQNSNSITGTYGGVSLLVNANEETKGTSVLKQVAINRNIDASSSLAVTGKVDISGSLYVNGVNITSGGSSVTPSLELVLATGNSSGNYNLNMNNKQIQNVNTLNFSTAGKITGTDISMNLNIDVSGNAKFNNLKYLNTTSNITITRGNFDTPTYSNGNNLLYTGTAPYTGYSGWTFSSNGGTFSVYIIAGLYYSPYYVTYFTSGNQCLVLVPSTPMVAKTDTYTLQEGEYILSFYVQAQSYGTAPSMTASVKTSTATLFSIAGIDPTTSFPNWVQYKMPFLIENNNTAVWFEFQNQSAYIAMDTLVLTMDNAVIVSDGVKTSAIGGSQTMLNGVYINGGINVTQGGINVVGGINTTTTYGTNNTAINSIMGEIVGSTNTNIIAIGTGTLQSSETSVNTIAIGNGVNTGAIESNNNSIIGFGASTADGADNCVVGYKAGCFGIGTGNVVMGSMAGKIQEGGTLNNYNVAMGYQVFQRYNGYGVLTGCEKNVAIGAFSQYSNADGYNTSVGCFSLYNMVGSDGVTLNGENGYNTKNNTALGYYAGNLYSLYNNCTFLGSNADATINDLYNATAIGYNCKVDASNTIQIGSNGEQVKISGDLAGITTINGVTYSPGSGSAGTLAQTLTLGNQANMAIDMSLNNLLRVKQINVATLYSGSASDIKSLSRLDMSANVISGVTTLFTNYISPYTTSQINLNANLNLQSLYRINSAAGLGVGSLAPTSGSGYSMYVSGNAKIDNLDMSAGNITNCNNINTTTINGLPVGGSTPSLASVLAVGNTASTNIDLSYNSLNNVNAVNLIYGTGAVNMNSCNINDVARITLTAGSTSQINGNGGKIIGMLSVSSELLIQSQTNITYPDLQLENINSSAVSGVRIRTTKKRVTQGLVNGDDLYTQETYGTDASNVLQLYATDTIEATTTAVNNMETTRTISLISGNSLFNVLQLNSFITANRPITLNGVGFNHAYRNIPMSANDTYASVWRNYVGNHVYVNPTGAQGWVLTIGNPGNYNGSITEIENTGALLVTLLITAGTFAGVYGNGTTSYAVYPNQIITLISNGTDYSVSAVRGIPPCYRRYNNVAQTLAVSGTGYVAFFDTDDTAGIQTTSGINTWSGTKLTYTPASGLFTNSTGENMTVHVEACIYWATNATIRYVSYGLTNTTRYPYARTGSLTYPAATTQNGYIGFTTTLANGDGFGIYVQSGTTNQVIGGTTAVNKNNIIITRIG